MSKLSKLSKLDRIIEMKFVSGPCSPRRQICENLRSFVFFPTNQSVGGSWWVPAHLPAVPSKAGATPHVLWDAAYDMGGTEVPS